MQERAAIDQKAREFFDAMWQQGDPWEFESSEYEQVRYARLLTFLRGRHYPRVLELGCGSGIFTQSLAGLAEQVVALDVSPAAIAQARSLVLGPATVQFHQANVMEYDLHAAGPWDLIVVSDIMCYLGWLYSFFDVGWFVSQLFATTRNGGYCLFTNAMGEFGDMLLLPWLIRTYRDLFRNVGYDLAAEDIFRGTKHGVTIENLMTLFIKPA